MKERETRGKTRQLQGLVKQAAGIITDDNALEWEGLRRRAEGVVLETFDRTRRWVDEFVDWPTWPIKK